MRPKSYRKPPDHPCAWCKHRLTVFESVFVPGVQDFMKGNICDIGSCGKWPEDRIDLFGICDEFEKRRPSET